MDGGEWGDTHDRALGVRLEAAGGATPALVLVNPHPRARRFVLPRGHWVPTLCSASADGQPEPQLLPRSDDLVAPHGACSVPARAVLVLLDNPG
jgi:glycogen operon protein